jgi:bile acid:Na+ symporter, BASS family
MVTYSAHRSRMVEALDDTIPLWLVNTLAFITVFSVMTSIGTTVTPSECLQHLRSPSLLFRGLINVLVIVPVIGLATTFAFSLTLPEQVGITLMVIAPGAPLALRRALTSGGDAGFAPTLQITVAIFAVPAVPLWVLIGNWILGTRGIIDASAVARQVFLAQLLPLAMGTMVKRLAPVIGARIGKVLERAAVILLMAVIIGILVNVRYSILLTHFWSIASAAIITIAAIAAGHLMGGALPEIRHAMAIAGAMRNVGLALLVASANQTPAVVEVVIISYALTAIIIVSGYIVWWTKKTAHSVAGSSIRR